MTTTTAALARIQDTNPGRLLTSNHVCTMLGVMCHMTLWRWSNSPTMNFPAPVYIARRKVWSEHQIASWLAAQQQNEPCAKRLAKSA
jgi:hypothetical protein